MTTPRAVRWAVLAAGLAACGCGGVNRRFVIESNVPNAQVYIDNKPVGPAPAHAQFEYYGFYTVTLVHPGYQTRTERVHVVSPWWSYPPIDFFSEILWPFRIEDVRRYYFELTPAAQTRTDDLIQFADALRERGWNLPPPSRPETPPREPAAPPGPVIGPPTGPVPGPGVPPGVTPLPAPTPVPGQPGPAPLPPPNPLIPSVEPSGFAPRGGETFLR